MSPNGTFRGVREARARGAVSGVAVVDAAPFVVVVLIGVLAGRFPTGSGAWLVALAPPVAHFALSVLTGRAGDDFLSYVVPVNLLLLGLAVLGLVGAWGLRRPQRSSSD